MCLQTIFQSVPYSEVCLDEDLTLVALFYLYNLSSVSGQIHICSFLDKKVMFYDIPQKSVWQLIRLFDMYTRQSCMWETLHFLLLSLLTLLLTVLQKSISPLPVAAFYIFHSKLFLNFTKNIILAKGHMSKHNIWIITAFGSSYYKVIHQPLHKVNIFKLIMLKHIPPPSSSSK